MQRRSPARVPGPSRSPVAAPAAAGHRPLLLAMALATGFAPLALHAQPTGAQAIVGAASLSQQGNKLVVTTQNGAGGFSAINWQSFSVPGGTTTYFAQPGASSTSINRVVGPDPSAIFGTLGSNGRLVLVNPAGITVGAGAVVDTAGFTASTLRMSDADALTGRLRFDGSAGGVLQVDGQVLARSGDVVLIGAHVQTGANALVQSPQGATVLAAGQKVEVTGRGLEGIVFEVQAPADQAVNLGTLKGDAVGVFAGTLKHSGLVQAQAVSVEGGRVVLKAAGQALVAGTVQAQGTNGAGGSVDVLGTQVGVLAGASIDTSNTAGGGQIRIGGDAQGANPLVANAQVTYVDGTAQLKANATDQGNGGKVIVWADDTTRMNGTIQANAGVRGGDGGFVETSGKRFLDARGARVSASSATGRAGTWLLDPDNLTIVAAPATGENYGNGSPDFTPAANGSASVIYDSTLNTALNAADGTNVTVTTGASSASFGSESGDIILQGGVNLYRDQSGSATLTLNAYNDILFTGGTTRFQAYTAVPSATPAPPQLNVVLNPGMASTLASGPGSVRIDSTGGLWATSPDYTGSVGITVRSGKGVTNDGALQLDYGTSFSADGLGTSGTLAVAGGSLTVGSFDQSGGSAQFTGGGNLTVTQAFASTGGWFDFDGGALDITQQAGNLTIPAGAWLWANGPVALRALAGDVQVNTDLRTVGSGVNIEATGSIGFTSINTGVSNNSSFSVAGGDATLVAGKDVTGGTVATGGYGGYDGSAAAGGRVFIASGAGTLASRGGSIHLTSISTAGGNAADGGAVTLAAYGGNVAVDEDIGTSGGADPFSVATGGAAGDVTVTSTRDAALGGGDISLGSVSAFGGYNGGRGGNVSLSAAGGSASFADVVTRAGWTDSTTLASASGSLHVDASTGISVGYVETGASSDPGTPGAVDLHSTGGDISQYGSITARTVIARADAGNVTLTDGENAIEAVAGSAAGAFAVHSLVDFTVDATTAPDGTTVAGIKAQSVVLRSAAGMQIGGTVETSGGVIDLMVNDGSQPTYSALPFFASGSLQLPGTLTSNGGDIRLRAGSDNVDGTTYNVTGSVDAGTGAVSIDGPGSLELSGSVRGGAVGVSVDEVNAYSAAVISTAGSLTITGNGPVTIYGSSLSAAGGDLAVSGGLMYSRAENSGLSVTDSSFVSSGKLFLDGSTSDVYSAGLSLQGNVSLDAPGGSTLTGANYNLESYGGGVSIGTSLLSGSGALSIQGRSSGTGAGVSVYGTTASWAGDIAISGTTAADFTGIDLYASSIASSGGKITLDTRQSLSGYAATLDSGGGNITLTGGNDALSTVGVWLTGSSVHAQTGNVTIAGRSGSDYGFRFEASGQALTVAGTDVLITGSSSSGGAAILVDGESITSTSSMRLAATGGGIEILNGSTLTNTGMGPMVLEALPGSVAAPLGILADASSVLATGSLRASGDDVLLQNVDFGSAGGALSGRAANGGFAVLNNGTGAMQVGTVDGVAGIAATGGGVSLATPGLLRLSEAVQSDAGPGSDAITLAANDLLTDGSGALLAPNDRWAVWLNAPTANLVGSPVSGSDAVWGRTFGIDTLSESGNRYVFRYQPTISLAATPITRTYDATDLTDELTASATGLVDASLYGNVFNQDLVLATLSVNSPSKNVGSYAINIDSYAIPQGYIDGGVTGATGTITKATLTVTGLTAEDKVYDRSTAASLAGTAALSGVFAGDSVGFSGSSANATFADKNVGVGKAVTVTGLGLSGSDNSNYVLVQPTLAASITPLALTVTGLTASNKLYDGTVSATVTGTATLTGLLGGDLVALLGTPTGTFADKNVATGKSVSLAPASLSGADAGNYTLQPLAPLLADVTPATLTVSGLTGVDKVYDGTTSASLAGTAALGGILGADVVSLGSATAFFADKNVGTGKGLTSSFGLNGVDALNYVVAPPTGLTASITPATLTLGGLAALGKVYDATTAATLSGNASLGGVLGTDLVALAGTASGAFADKNVGTAKPVTVSGLGLTGVDAGNYTFAPVSVLTADITPAPVTVAGLTAASKVYDATTAATLAGTATLGGLLGNDVLALTGTAAGSFADKNVGTAKPVTLGGLALAGADAGNYRVTPSALAADITPATLTLGGLSAADKVYDATTAATLTGSAGVVGVLRTDSVALTGSPTGAFADKNVGTGKPVSVALGSAALSGADAGNYVLLAPAPLSASITPAPLVVTATDQNKLQGSGFTFAGSEFSAVGLKGGEQVASVALSSAGSASDAGFGSYAIAAGAPLAGANGFQAANYLVSYQPGTMLVSTVTTLADQQVTSPLLTFLTLFTQQTLLPPAPLFDEDGKPKGRPDIVGTDGTTCRPV